MQEMIQTSFTRQIMGSYYKLKQIKQKAGFSLSN